MTDSVVWLPRKPLLSEDLDEEGDRASLPLDWATVCISDLCSLLVMLLTDRLQGST